MKKNRASPSPIGQQSLRQEGPFNFLILSPPTHQFRHAHSQSVTQQQANQVTAPVQLSGGGNKHENKEGNHDWGGGRAKVNHMTSLKKKKTNGEEWEELPSLEWNWYFWVTFFVFFLFFFLKSVVVRVCVCARLEHQVFFLL